jgi:hypothetical protein
MGTYNTVVGVLTCPHCGVKGEVRAECRFGDTGEMNTYHPGDTYAWRPGKAVQNGGRPPDGNCDGDGYTECSHCGQDFFVTVPIRGDQIQEMWPDLTKPPYKRLY